MKTITFYSYKGGVGRSLALSNMAIRLSQLNKKVCVLDFDLDAPGLQFKFSDYTAKQDFEKGIVDYIYQYSKHGIVPTSIKDYANVLTPNTINATQIEFISAGNINTDEYWKQLSMIRWADLFYSEKGQGIRFFLDLKAKIEKEINPDVLLIDSRTGITDISGITLRLLADEVVVLAVNNKENLFGTKRILKSLLNEQSLLKRNPKVRFVLTRLPFTDTPQDKEKEFLIVQERKTELIEYLGLDDFDISLIHSDRRLEEKESHLMAIDYNNNVTSVANDYLKLFDLITSDILTSSEIENFKTLKFAEIEYNNALNEKDPLKRISRLDKAISLKDDQFKFYFERGNAKWLLGRMEDAINDFETVLMLNPLSGGAKYNLGLLYYNVKDIEKALDYLNQVQYYPLAIMSKSMILEKQGKLNESLEIINEGLKKYPNLDELLNSKADALRKLKKFDEALQNIYRAIEINPNEALYFATLAEISADMGNNENFYLNITVALSKNLKAKAMSFAIDAYERYFSEKRFLELLEKYQIKVDDIINEANNHIITIED